MKPVGFLLMMALVGCAQPPFPTTPLPEQSKDDQEEMFQGAAYAVAMSREARWVLTADSVQDQPGGNHRGIVNLWDLESGKRKAQFKGHQAEIRAVAFSPDERWILSGGASGEEIPGRPEDNSARLWDLSTGKEIHRFDEHTSDVFAVQFSPDGKLILTGASDGTIRLWDVQTGKLIYSHPKYVPTTLSQSSLSFSPSGTEILMLTRPGAQILDTRTGAVIHKIEVAEPGYHGFNSAEYSPDGRLIVTAASSDKTARLWDARTGLERRTLKGHTNFVLHASFSQDGTKVVTAGHDETVRIWNAGTGEQLKEIKLPGSVGEARFVAEDKRFMADWRSDANYKVVSGVSLWDIESGREIRRMSDWHPLAFSKNRRKVLVGGQLWDASSGDLLRDYSTQR